MQETHHYEPLRSKSHIRLLEIKSPDPKYDRNCFVFKIVQLDPWALLVPRLLSKYECVSYCWAGTGADEAKKITLEAVTGSTEKGWLLSLVGNQGSIKITASLVEALPYLCHETKTGHLWIDQLCINQHDPEERSMQVSRMGHIYSKAERTIVWLGSQPPWMDRDLRARERFRILLGPIFDRSWFNRGWVVQEFVLAEYVDFLFETGCYTAAFMAEKAPLITMSPLHLSILQDHSSDQRTGAWRGAAAFNFMQSLRRNMTLSVQSTTDSSALLQGQLRMLWICAGTFETTEPRDRIFAYLGLLSEITYLPDYGLGLRAMLIDLTVKIMQQSQRLDILAYARRKEGSDPSWAPTWRHSLTERPRSSIPTDYTESWRIWAPFGSTSLQWQAWPHGLLTHPEKLPYDVLPDNRLLVRGRTIGEARCIAGPVHEGWTKVLKDASKGIETPGYNAVLKLAKSAQKPVDILNIIWAGLRMPGESSWNTGRTEGFHRGLEPRIEARIDSLNDGDKMIITVGQDKLGISSMAFETGCIEVVLFNCYVPLILAPSAKVDGCFELVCSAFVDGVMYGEAMADHDEQGPLQEFILV